MIYDNLIRPDFEYIKPDHFKDDDPTDDGIYYDEFDIDDYSSNQDIPEWQTPTGVPFPIFSPEYDASGNILRLRRNVFDYGTDQSEMDDMEYSYINNTNKLQYVYDGINHGQTFQIKDIDPAEGYVLSGGYYSYDNIGNLTKDAYEGLDEITWTPDGKIKSYKFDRLTPGEETDFKCAVEFTYDGMGNRVRKTLIKGLFEDSQHIPYEDPCCDDEIPGNDNLNSLSFTNTYYARGANGKVKAVYNLIYDNLIRPDFEYIKPDHFKDDDPTDDGIYYDEFDINDYSTDYDVPTWKTSGSVPFPLFSPEYDAFLAIYEFYLPKLSEWYIYGSGAQGRFASRKPDYEHVLYQGPPDLCYSEYESRIIGLKPYELTDHLGNPRVIFSDVREEEYELTYLGGTSYVVSYIGSRPEIVPLEMNNYYPFGMLKDGMTANIGNGYRYGFNGMERDNESKGFGNDLSTYFRGYDPRLGRWKSVDPVTKAMESAYVGFGNNPVLFVDPRGDEIHPGYFLNRMLSQVNQAIKNAFQSFKSDPVGTTEKTAENIYAKNKNRINMASEPILLAVTFTDVNDALVVSSWIVYGSDDAINADGTYADGWDKGCSVAALIVPVAGGKTLKYTLKPLAESTSQTVAAIKRYFELQSKIDKTIVKKGEDWYKLKELPIEEHHILTNKSKVWKPRFEEILKKYDLGINDEFNKIDLHQRGKHPDTYHIEMNELLIKIDKEADGNRKKFLRLFKENIYNYVEQNPEIIHHNYKIIGE